MTYTGKVVEGGAPDVRELAELMITKMVVGDFGNNTYLLRCRLTDEQLLIDAAAEPDRILKLVGSDGLKSVVTTHQHGDHWQALAEVVEATGATTYAGEHDADGIPVPTAVPVKDGDTITVGSATLTAIHLVGHTPGSIALLYDDPEGTPHLFTGDCLRGLLPGLGRHRRRLSCAGPVPACQAHVRAAADDRSRRLGPHLSRRQ